MRTTTDQPTLLDEAYGPHPSMCFDFFPASTDRAAPLVILIHGGGWIAGDKKPAFEAHGPALLDHGFAVASINYRLLGEVGPDVIPPVKIPLTDAARAVQTLRHRSRALGIDPARVAFWGGSAGACTSLWLAFHDDLADPGSDDPVARQSTRPTCVIAEGVRSSLDPQQMQDWIPGIVYGPHAFGVGAIGENEFRAFLERRAELLPLIEEYSPYGLADAGAPPVYMYFDRSLQLPDNPDELRGWRTHHPMFGIKLKEKLDACGVRCHLSYPESVDPTAVIPSPSSGRFSWYDVADGVRRPDNMTYALLQKRLDQTIDRRAMEEASVAAPGIARADCARLHRELFGIVARRLQRQDALNFQAALRERGFETDLVEDSRLAQLMPARNGGALRFESDAVVLTDTLYQREHRFPREWYVLAAGGFLVETQRKARKKMELEYRPGGAPRGVGRAVVKMVKDYQYEDVPAFRLELFLSREPYRQQWALSQDDVLRVDGKPVRLRDRPQLILLMKKVAECLPADRVNQGLDRGTRGEEFTYPSESAFEEEIVWRFYRLGFGQGTE